MNSECNSKTCPWQGGKLLAAEPYIHVSKANFQDTLNCAANVGFKQQKPEHRINFCRAVILEKA